MSKALSSKANGLIISFSFCVEKPLLFKKCLVPLFSYTRLTRHLLFFKGVQKEEIVIFFFLQKRKNPLFYTFLIPSVGFEKPILFVEVEEYRLWNFFFIPFVDIRPGTVGFFMECSTDSTYEGWLR